MGQIKRFEQFYFTNVGQGQRFEGISVPDAFFRESLGVLTPGFMNSDVVQPVLQVAYNSRLRSYAAAMVRDASDRKEPRVTCWVHGYVPASDRGDGFMACLSIPDEAYHMDIEENASLTAAEIETEDFDIPAILDRYDLRGDRLACLMARVFMTLADPHTGDTLYILTDPEMRGSRMARDLMAVIYAMLPPARRTQASFVSMAGSDQAGWRFVFRTDTAADNAFDPAGEIRVPCASLEWRLMLMLAGCFEEDRRRYQLLIREICPDAGTAFEDMMWAFFRQRIVQEEDFDMDQEDLVAVVGRVEARTGEDEIFKRLLCRFLSMIDTDGRKEVFCQSVFEKYAAAAAALSDPSCREYRDGLKDLSAMLSAFGKAPGGRKERYEDWIREEFPDLYQDLKGRQRTGGEGLSGSRQTDEADAPGLKAPGLRRKKRMPEKDRDQAPDEERPAPDERPAFSLPEGNRGLLCAAAAGGFAGSLLTLLASLAAGTAPALIVCAVFLAATVFLLITGGRKE